MIDLKQLEALCKLVQTYKLDSLAVPDENGHVMKIERSMHLGPPLKRPKNQPVTAPEANDEEDIAFWSSNTGRLARRTIASMIPPPPTPEAGNG